MSDDKLRGIADEWFSIHDGMCVRSIEHMPFIEHFRTALQQARDLGAGGTGAAKPPCIPACVEEQKRQAESRQFRADVAEGKRILLAAKPLPLGHDGCEAWEEDGVCRCQPESALRAPEEP